MAEYYNPKYKKNQYKYDKEHLKRIPLDVQRSDYDRIKAAADAAGLPVNTWIKSVMFAALGASGAPSQDRGGDAVQDRGPVPAEDRPEDVRTV